MRNKKPTTVEKVQSGACAIYIRVSTLDQGERYSLPSQLKALRDKAAHNGLKVREDWIFVDKHTGKSQSRPEFDKLKALVRTGAPDAVYIFDVSRFARKTMDALWLAAEFKRHGVKLGFVEVPYEDTPTGRLTFTNMAAIAEYVGEKIIEDSKRGQLIALEMGFLTHGSACYGYVYINKRKANGRRLEIDKSESTVAGLSKVQVVRDIFRWRRNGMAVSRIVEKLNEAGIRSAGRIGKGGAWIDPRLWCRTTVKQMLHNPTYMGKHSRCGITVACEAIIDEDTWNAVQEVNRLSLKANTGRPSRSYLLRGYLWCGKCGFRCVTKTNNGCPAYFCGNVERTPWKRLCLSKQVGCKKIEHAAWESIWGLLNEPQRLLRMAEDSYGSGHDANAAKERKLRKEEQRLDGEIERVQHMVQKNMMKMSQAEGKIFAAQRRITEIHDELRALGRIVNLPTKNMALDTLREITAGAEPQTYDERRDILERIQDLKMVYFDGNLEISGKIPMPGAVKSETSEEKKWSSGVGAYTTSFAPIPFVLKLRVG